MNLAPTHTAAGDGPHGRAGGLDLGYAGLDLPGHRDEAHHLFARLDHLLDLDPEALERVRPVAPCLDEALEPAVLETRLLVAIDHGDVEVRLGQLHEQSLSSPVRRVVQGRDYVELGKDRLNLLHDPKRLGRHGSDYP